MSFELFLQRFAQGVPAGIPAAAIRAAFGAALSELEEDFWQVSYANGQSSDLLLASLGDDLELVHTVSVYRPCTEARLYEALWKLLELPGTCLHFPGDAPPLARDPAIADALPPAMLAALGTPTRVDSPAAIAMAIPQE